MRFIVIRHGQSTNNLLWEKTGSEAGRDPDTPLTETGHTQARRLGEAFAAWVVPWRVDAIYCSLMTRAVQTATPVAQALDLPLLGRGDLYEVGGPFDLDATGSRVPFPGASASALRATSPRIVLPDTATEAGWWAGPVEDEADGPTTRARTVIRSLRAAHPADATVALVSHGYFSQFLFREFLGITSMAGWVEIHNTSLTVYEDREGFDNVRALRTDWTPHLTEDLLTT